MSAYYDDPNQKFVSIRKKYPTLDLHQGLIPTQTWGGFFSTGSIPAEEINTSLKNSKYFQSKNQPTWVKCWHGTDLYDDQFSTLFEKLQQEWADRFYKQPGEVLHIIGLFLEYSRSGLYAKSIDEVTEDARSYIDWLKEKGHIQPISELHRSLYEGTGYDGLGFHSTDDEKFKALRIYLEEQRAVVLEESFPKEAEHLVLLVKTDPDLFLHSLILSNNKENRFYKTPILRYIKPETFVSALLDAEPNHRRTVSYVFSERYKQQIFLKELYAELSWLKEVQSILEKEVEKRVGKISAYSLSKFILPQLAEGIRDLKKGELRLVSQPHDLDISNGPVSAID